MDNVVVEEIRKKYIEVFAKRANNDVQMILNGFINKDCDLGLFNMIINSIGYLKILSKERQDKLMSLINRISVYG